jgi:copper chaperone
MIAFEVDDMTCGHCVSAINKALKAVDSEAKVDIDLGRHLVQIRSEHADVQALGDAIKDAGYTPVPASAATGAARPAAKSGGCCCG